MQRTVHGTTIKFATVEKDTNGQLAIVEHNYKSTEKDTKKAVKEFRKNYPNDAIISTEEFTQLYVLDDEIFFKYAVPVDTTEEIEEWQTETGGYSPPNPPKVKSQKMILL